MASWQKPLLLHHRCRSLLLLRRRTSFTRLCYTSCSSLSSIRRQPFLSSRDPVRDSSYREVWSLREFNAMLVFSSTSLKSRKRKRRGRPASKGKWDIQSPWGSARRRENPLFCTNTTYRLLFHYSTVVRLSLTPILTIISK